MLKIYIQSIKDYFTKKKQKGQKLQFFEEIGDSKTSKEEMMKKLVELLESKGLTYKGTKYRRK